MKLVAPILFFTILLITSCTDQAAFSGKLSFQTEGHWKPMIYLIDPGSFDGIGRSYIGNILDSAAVTPDGDFAFEKMPDAPEPILLQVAIQKKGERFLNKLDNEDPGNANYLPIVWKNGARIELAAEADHFQRSFSFKHPSPENAAMLQLRDLRQAAFDQYLAGKDEEAHDENQLLEAEKALLNFQQSLMTFAETSPHLLPALTAIRWMSIEANYERIPEFMVGQCEKWQKAEPDHPWVAQLCRYGNREVLPVLKRDTIPDFSLPMLSGDTLALRQLLGEQLTILDLWASWCAPCRKENRDYLVPLWEQYHEAGFQIIGYALDASPKVWKGAIEKDGADRWLHASHLQGDDAPLLETLRITTIPANFLIDEEGKVVAKNLHGDALAQFLAGFFE